MERARATWTDERLDDLSRRVDNGFARVDQDIRTLRSDMNTRFDSMEAKFDAKFDQLQGRIYLFGSGLLVAVLGSSFIGA